MIEDDLGDFENLTWTGSRWRRCLECGVEYIPTGARQLACNAVCGRKRRAKYKETWKTSDRGAASRKRSNKRWNQKNRREKKRGYNGSEVPPSVWRELVASLTGSRPA